jgi:hypothetical protein
LIEIANKDRALSTYICGNPGSGKSSLMQRMILHDIRQGAGVCVIDPTAQLIKVLIGHLPKERLEDVVHFTTAAPVPLDFFSYRDDDERQELVGDISNIIDLSTAPIAKNYLRKIINALFEANRHPEIYQPDKGIDRRYTLFDIPRFVQSETKMGEVLSHCAQDRAYDFPPHIKIQADTISAIIMRLSTITDSAMMQTVLGAPGGGLNIADMISENKIFLVDLKETENDQIIGSIIAAKIQHAIFARRHLEDLHACTPYSLYIDECDVILKFAEARFAAILGRARKYKLFMTIANPIPSDLPAEIQRGLGKIGNLILFNLDESDAHIFKSKIAPYRPDYLVNIPAFHALFRTNRVVTRVKTPTFLKPRATENAKYIRESTLRYCAAHSCKTPPVPHTSLDGEHHQEINVQTDPHTSGSPSDPRRVFRPQKQGSRTHRPQTKPDPE